MEKKKKRQKLKYLKKLWNKILVEDAVLMENGENLQVVETKYKKVINIFLKNKTR